MVADGYARACDILASAFGPGAAFHDGQWDAIEAILAPGARRLVVQKTGWGKSVVYFLATRLLREAGKGPTLLVSPLLALMRNQIELAAKFGVRAASLNSSNREEWSLVEDQIRADQVDLLLVSPERLGNEHFRDGVLPRLERSMGLLVIDEAHCISDWGHDFRPDYRRILSSVARLDESIPILGTTATANDRVIADIREQLGDRLVVTRGPLMRESLRLRALRLGSQAERLAWLAKYVPRLPGSGIVYTSTVNDSQRVAEWLRSNGVDAEAYYGALEVDLRLEIERRFRDNALKVIVATTALGMGYDKSDVAFVIHYQRPGSIIGYYQQIGRAGRGIPKAEVVLLTGWEDDDIVEHFITSAFPDRDCFESVQATLQRGPATVDFVCSKSNFRRSQVETALRLLEVENAAVREDGKYRMVGADWRYENLRADEITQQRRRELDQMRDYTEATVCRMRFLASALDSPEVDDCGRCDVCKPTEWPPLDPGQIAAAVEFLQQGSQAIKPKAYWPAGFAGEGRKKIEANEVLLPGAALCVYGDAGWGVLVRRGKYELGRFPDELLAPSIRALSRLGLKPEWLTFVPTLKPSRLVADFAERLAKELGIPCVAAVRKVRSTADQKSMQNSTTQLGNVWGSFEASEPPAGVGILFDDVVDSGWTLACIGAKLRRAGSGPILPFALAASTPRDE